MPNNPGTIRLKKIPQSELDRIPYPVMNDAVDLVEKYLGSFMYHRDTSKSRHEATLEKVSGESIKSVKRNREWLANEFRNIEAVFDTSEPVIETAETEASDPVVEEEAKDG